MKIDELKQAKDQRPFVPYRIHAADGREVLIKHPDAVAWDVDDPRMVFAVSGGERHWIDVALVSSLVFSEPAETEGSNGGT
jgi:hypothetical protein